MRYIYIRLSPVLLAYPVSSTFFLPYRISHLRTSPRHALSRRPCPPRPGWPAWTRSPAFSVRFFPACPGSPGLVFAPFVFAKPRPSRIIRISPEKSSSQRAWKRRRRGHEFMRCLLCCVPDAEPAGKVQKTGGP